MAQRFRFEARDVPRKFAGAAVICLAWSRPLLAGPAPEQRGEHVPPGTVAASVVTLCGLAVMLVVQPRDGKATLYAGEAMKTKLSELGIDDETSGAYELADLYDPIGPACQRIRSEHERLLRTQLKN